MLAKLYNQKCRSARIDNFSLTLSRLRLCLCPVSFSQKSNLSRHMQIHDGFRYFCPVCPNKASSFGQRYDLQRHIVRKHPGHRTTLIPTLVAEKVAE